MVAIYVTPFVNVVPNRARATICRRTVMRINDLFRVTTPRVGFARRRASKGTRLVRRSAICQAMFSTLGKRRLPAASVVLNVKFRVDCRRVSGLYQRRQDANVNRLKGAWNGVDRFQLIIRTRRELNRVIRLSMIRDRLRVDPNASNFNHQGGHITLRSRRTPVGAISVRVAVIRRHVVLTFI